MHPRAPLSTSRITYPSITPNFLGSHNSVVIVRSRYNKILEEIMEENGKKLSCYMVLLLPG
jgi:hypothetical protein